MKEARTRANEGRRCFVPRYTPARRRPAAWLFLGVGLLLVGLGTLPVGAADDAWGRYFPDQPSAPADDTGWEELSQARPNRVKRPAATPGNRVPAPAATLVEISTDITYLRIRHLAGDLGELENALAQPRLIVDLRYIRSALAEALQFGALLARSPLRLETVAGTEEPGLTIAPRHLRTAEQLTLCLINRATSGPVEAVLEALQAAGEVLLVGTQSAGDTGRFGPATQAPEWHVILGDFRRGGGPSLLDVGVTPGLFVETIPEREDIAYLAFDAGRPMADLLNAPVQKPRFDEATLIQQFDAENPRNGRTRPSRRAPAHPESSPPAIAPHPEGPVPEIPGDAPDASGRTLAPFDRSLQRAVNTLLAHRFFHAPSTVAAP